MKLFKKTEKVLRSDQQKRIHGIGIEVFRRVTLRTPVDTGKARAGWYYKAKPDQFTIRNNTNYIVYLEYGHSQQAPAGIVRITLKEIKEMLRFKK